MTTVQLVERVLYTLEDPSQRLFKERFIRDFIYDGMLEITMQSQPALLDKNFVVQSYNVAPSTTFIDLPSCVVKVISARVATPGREREVEQIFPEEVSSHAASFFALPSYEWHRTLACYVVGRRIFFVHNGFTGTTPSVAVEVLMVIKPKRPEIENTVPETGSQFSQALIQYGLALAKLKEKDAQGFQEYIQVYLATVSAYTQRALEGMVATQDLKPITRQEVGLGS